MSLPQAGIFVEGSHRHIFLEFELLDATSDAALQASLANAIGALQDLDGRQLNVVWAFGAGCWQRLGRSQPAGLKPFSAVGNGAVAAPATQRSILLWLNGDEYSALFDAAMKASELLADVAAISLEINGFLYKDSRDLSGFIDGTENPKGEGQRKVALIPEGQPGAGGSFVLSQQWQHNLKHFRAMSQHEQEKVIGRTKPDSVELKGDAMPDDSHVSRSDVKIDGVAQKLYRRSVPYGGVSQHGLYFLSFSCEIERYDHILASMFGKADDGIVDRLNDFSTPLSGSYWFAPSAAELSDLASD
ncbi:Dyp-type peroxidase [uncultured Spongiibacter sp.]|uniref:Dyp-type peroxidase n=1 Tax=uncultured Spongiibacter sp. TaxID=870896 RepID=UPI002582604B|nr:Dyp-type peroxidase [uncultured Spongiibacter sp.]